MAQILNPMHDHQVIGAGPKPGADPYVELVVKRRLGAEWPGSGCVDPGLLTALRAGNPNGGGLAGSGNRIRSDAVPDGPH